MSLYVPDALWEPVTPTDYLAYTPAGTISSTNIPDAINELDTEKVPYTDPHYIVAKYLAAVQLGAIV